MPVKSPIKKMTSWPNLLELAHFVDEYGVAEVQIRRGRIESCLDAQRLAALDLSCANPPRE